LEDYELYMETKDPKDLHRIYVEIYDVTDREALSKMANSARFKAFRREARAILQQLDAQIGTDAPAK
jgi:quinol monooxygenase YgiN